MEYFDWRAVFVVNVPVVVAGMLVTRRDVPPVPAGIGRAIDLPGQLLAIVFLTSLTGALIEAGEHAWASPWVWGPLAIAAVSLAALLVVEGRHRDPVVPLALFRRPGFAAGNAIGVLINLGFYGQLFVLGLFFQEVLDYSPLRAGLAFLPLFAATFFLSWGAGRMTARWGPVRPMVIGLVIGLAGLLFLLPADAGISYWALVPGLLLVSAGALDPGPPLGRGHRGRAAGAVRGRLGRPQRDAPDRRRAGGGDPRIPGRGQRLRHGMRWALVISAVAYGLALALTLLFMGARGARVPLGAEPASSTSAAAHRRVMRRPAGERQRRSSSAIVSGPASPPTRAEARSVSSSPVSTFRQAPRSSGGMRTRLASPSMRSGMAARTASPRA